MYKEGPGFRPGPCGEQYLAGPTVAAHSWQVLAEHSVEQLGQQAAPLLDTGAVVRGAHVLNCHHQVRVDAALDLLRRAAGDGGRRGAGQVE